MSKQPAIIVDNVSMKFNLSKEKVDSLKDYIIKSIKKEIKYNEFWALQNVSFTVEKGDRVGILGLNGAGKSTTIKLILNMIHRDCGSISILGRDNVTEMQERVLFLRLSQAFSNQQKVQLQNMGRWFRFWNWVQDLINSIQERKIFIFTEQCLDIPKNLLMRSMMRS